MPKNNIKKSIDEQIFNILKSDLESRQIDLGKEIEKEHIGTFDEIIEELGLNPNSPKAKKVKEEAVNNTIKDHLKEIPDYYDRLKNMEDKAKTMEKAAIVNKDTMSFTDINSVNLSQFANSDAAKTFITRFTDNLKAGDTVPIPIGDDCILKLYKIEEGIYSGHIEASDGTITHNIDKATIPEIVTHLVSKEKLPEEVKQADIPAEQPQSEDKNITINVVIKKSKENKMDKLDKMINEVFGSQPLNKADIMDEDEKRKILENKTKDKMEQAEEDKDQKYTDADYGTDKEEPKPEEKDEEEVTPMSEDAPEKLEKEEDDGQDEGEEDEFVEEDEAEDTDEDSDNDENMFSDEDSDEDFEMEDEGSEDMEQPEASDPKGELVNQIIDTAKEHHGKGYRDNVKDLAKFLLHLLHTEGEEMPDTAEKAIKKSMKMLPKISNKADKKELFKAYKGIIQLRNKFLSKGKDSATMITKILAEKRYGKEVFAKAIKVGSEVVESKLNKSADDMIVNQLKKKILNKSETEETISELRKSQEIPQDFCLSKEGETATTKFFKSFDLQRELTATKQKPLIPVKKSAVDYVELAKGKIIKKTDNVIIKAIAENTNKKG